jgi:hypothetical protein
MNRLKEPVIPKANIIGRLYWPTIANGMEIAVILFRYIDPRMALAGNHWLNSKR